MFSKIFKRDSKSRNNEVVESFSSWKELPGYSEPSIEDLNFEVFNFERSVKNFLSYEGQPTNKKLFHLIEDMRGFPPTPEFQAEWDLRVEQMQELRKLRNKLVHHKLEELHEVIDEIQHLDFDKSNKFNEIYSHFRTFNRILIPLKICSGDMSRFDCKKVENGTFFITIDNDVYSLNLDDINNLHSELEVDYRGKVNFSRGKMVVGKVQDFSYESVTYFIEGFPPFSLDYDEIAVFSEFLSSIVGAYSDSAIRAN